MPMQTWGADLSEIDFDDLIYYQKPSDKPARSWDDVPEKIKETFGTYRGFQKLSVLI